MSSISEHSPVKSSSSDSKLSSLTTSFPEYSSISTSSSNKSQMEDLKKRVQLLKIQLQQREKELAKEKCVKEGEAISQKMARTELDQLKSRASTLQSICEDLLEWIRTNEEDEGRRIQEIEQIYKKNIKTLTSNNTTIKAQNGQLQQELRAADTKISSVVHENNFLRWENESMKKELNQLKEEIDTLNRERTQLRSELSKTDSELRQIKKRQADRVEVEVQSVVDSTTNKIEKVRRVHDDREKEYGIRLTRMQNEIDFYRSESERKETQTARLTELLDQITLDNKRLFEMNVEQRKGLDSNVTELKHSMARMEIEKEDAQRERDHLREKQENIERLMRKTAKSEVLIKNTASKKENELQAAEMTIATLRRQVAELTAVDDVIETDVRQALKQKTLRLIELEQTVRELSRECSEEREQRDNSTVLLAEMSKDMKMLIEKVKRQ